MADSQYLAGVSAGWNAANADDPNAALQKLHESRTGYLKPLSAARAPAESAPAWASQVVIEYRYTGGTHWCQLGPAERMKPNFDGVYRLQGGVFPVDAPADSVTAPAATPTAASIAWTALRDLTDPLGEAGVKIMGHVRIYAQRQYEAGLTEGRATPPAQAAESVLEDAARYRYLRDGDWREHEKLEAVIRLQLNVLWDETIDAARKQGGAT